MTLPSFENVSDIVFYHAEARPEAPAFIMGCETLSYAQFARLIGQATVYLGERGLKQGDRVGISMVNSLEHAILLLALLRVGATPVELSIDLDSAGLAGLVSRYQMAATFTDIGGPVSRAPMAVQIGLNWRAELAAYHGDQRCAARGEEIFMISLSSGSTGIQKGIVVSHAQRLRRMRVYAETEPYWHMDDPLPLLLLAPPNNGLITHFLPVQLLMGGVCILLPLYRRFIDLARECAGWKGVICPMPPDLACQMLAYARPGELLFPDMAALVVAGQPLAAHHKLAILERLTPKLYDVYGSAGFGLIAMIGEAEQGAHAVSVGRIISHPGMEVEFLGADGQPVPASIGGQMRLRGPTMAQGFFHAEDNKRGTERFSDGWYYPGDVGRVDEQGYLVILGRLADAIRLGGRTIYPVEVEEVITRHADVLEAAVVSRAVPGGGVELCAFIVARPGANRHAIATHCRRQLPPEKQPKYLLYLDRMPATPGNKLDRPALRNMPVNLPAPL
jgi:acyl-CoA synthetase (AMP-forming)/AMP-acid ligase II